MSGDENFHSNMSQSHSDDDLQHSNSNLNDCNLLLNHKRNPETSLFDDSSLATVIIFRISHVANYSWKNKFSLSLFTTWAPFWRFHSASVRLQGKARLQNFFIDFLLFSQNIRRWSLNISRNGKQKRPFYHFMPSNLHKSKLETKIKEIRWKCENFAIYF